MTLPYEFEPEAEQELRDAAAWYEAEHERLGEAFLDRAREATDLVRQFPDAGSPVKLARSALGLRQIRLQQFRYRLVYMVAEGKVIIVAVAHDRRRPGYWTDRRS